MPPHVRSIFLSLSPHRDRAIDPRDEGPSHPWAPNIILPTQKGYLYLAVNSSKLSSPCGSWPSRRAERVEKQAVAGLVHRAAGRTRVVEEVAVEGRSLARAMRAKAAEAIGRVVWSGCDWGRGWERRGRRLAIGDWGFDGSKGTEGGCGRVRLFTGFRLMLVESQAGGGSGVGGT